MNSQKKPKITIKSFKNQVVMDPEYGKKTWNILKSAIEKIHQQDASDLSFEELYRSAYNMVLHKCGDILYEGLKVKITEHLQELAKKISSSSDENFINELNKTWTQHKISMLMIRDILMYMDRVYVVQHNLLSVYDLGLTLFRDHIARYQSIKEKLLKTLLSLIYKERIGEQINRMSIKNITNMLIELGVNNNSVYEEDFEIYFLEDSAIFYRSESQLFIQSNTCSDYMKKVENRIKEELERVSNYLHSSTEPKIKEVIERELIAKHMKYLAEMENSGCIAMLRDDKIEDLKRMYKLFGCVVNGHNIMREIITKYIKETGESLIMDEEKQKEHLQLIQSLLDMKDKYDKLLSVAFNGDKSFIQAINQSFEYFLNKNPKSPEFISLFIDEKLKKGFKGASEEEIDLILDKVMMLFRFLQEKDVFEKYYKQHLAKRLLLGRSISDDAERNMIAKLKTECGYQFTSKLEGMFTDMKLSLDTMDSFKSYIKDLPDNPLGGIDLNVSILTTGFWPTHSSNVSCKLPIEILKCCEIFKKFYLSHHNGRRINWQTNMGSAELKTNYSGKKHELNVSTYQMVILLLFNERNEFSYKELYEATAIPTNDLKRNLLALISNKHKILNKNPDNNKIDETDIFSLNSKFRSNLFKIKVMSVIQKESEPERKETRQKIDEDRKHQIEAAIVRIMKARKTMEHSQLILEVTKQLSSRFMPNPSIIKKRIESLIEREYLERSKSDR